MKKILIIISILLVFPASAILAQEGISSTVEVKREFEGRLLEISKSKLDTKYSDTLTKLNLKFDYSIFDRPIKDLYEFSPMQSAHLNREGLIRYPVLYAKIAASYPWMPEADIYVQPRFGDKFSMVIYGNHHSFWGNKGVDTVGPSVSNRMVNKGGLSLAYAWKSGEITTTGYYSHNLYYFNNAFKNANSFQESTTFQHIGADFRVRSITAQSPAFYYDVKFKYLNTNEKGGSLLNAAVENRFDADALFGVNIKNQHKVLLGIQSSNAIILSYPYTTYHHSYGNVEITPQYRYDSGRWRVKAGITFALRYSKDITSGEQIKDSLNTGIAKVYPNFLVSFEAAKNSLWLYALADGENKLVSISTMLMQNPWISHLYNGVGNHSTPIRVEMGLNGVVRDLFSYSIGGSYSHYGEYLSYYSLGTYPNSTTFKNLDVLYLKAEVLFKSKAFSAGANWQYVYFFDKTKIPYMVPSFKVNFFGRYNYRQRLFFEVNLRYYSLMKGWGLTEQNNQEPYGVIDVPGFVDLGAKFTFAVNSKISVFAQGQNLINQKIMYVQNYLEPGINFGLGIYLKL